MSFESEILLARLHPRGTKLVLPTLLLLIATFLASLLSDKFTVDWQNYVLYSACGALAFFGFAVPLIRYLTTYTDITNARIRFRSGLFGQNHFEASLTEISKVELHSNREIELFLRGEEEPMVLSGLPRPKLIAREIGRLIERRGFNV